MDKYIAQQKNSISGSLSMSSSGGALKGNETVSSKDQVIKSSHKSADVASSL